MTRFELRLFIWTITVLIAAPVMALLLAGIVTNQMLPLAAANQFLNWRRATTFRYIKWRTS